jgi:competence protein ComEC
MRVVALSALVILLAMPESWIDPSFQMSFAAVVGLVSAFEWWQRRQGPADILPTGLVARGFRILGGTAATSLIAGLATAPFAAYHFNRFANYGIAANLLAMPVVSFVIMPAGVIALLLMPLGLDAPPLQIMGWGINIMLDIAHWVAAWPGASLRVTTMPVIALILMVAGGLWLALWQEWWRFAGVALVAVGFGASFFGSAPDLIIAGDGRNFAVRGVDGQLYLLSARRGVFGAEQWLKRDADARDVKEARGGADIFACDTAGCIAKINGRDDRRVLYARTADAFHDGCEDASIIIDQTHGWRPPCGTPLLVASPKLLRQEGAIALTLDGDKISWTSVTRERGLRPWTRPAPIALRNSR